MGTPPGGTWVFFAGYVQLATQNLCRILAMLWPIIDPIFACFWARPEWNGMGAVY